MAPAPAAARAPNWSALPIDIMHRVVGRLPTGNDRLHAGAVCRQWRAAVRRRRLRHGNGPVVYLALVNGMMFSFPDAKPARARPAAGCAHYCGACDDRLLFADKDYFCYRLTSPFTGRTTALPSLAYIPDDTMGPDISVRKLVVCPDGLIAAIIGREHFAKVALCTLEFFSWSLGADDEWRWYEDMVYYEGKLYAITNSGQLLTFDVSYENTGEPKIRGVETVIGGRGHIGVGGMRYLVKSRSGGLLMVRRIMQHGKSTYAFQVYKADLRPSGSQWERVIALGGDEALFVSRLSSRAVRTDREGLEGYRIFFLDDTVGMSFRSPEPMGQPLYHAGVYDMMTGNVTQLLPRMWRKDHDGTVPPTWLFPEDPDEDDE
nr:F-box protein At3g56470-like [Aegilops tauschii subsp. strangulata]